MDILTGCHIWLGGRDPLGYGRIYIDGKGFLAHRVAYAIVNGAIPGGLASTISAGIRRA